MIAAAILTPLSLWKMYAFYLYYNTYMGKEIKKMVKILLRLFTGALKEGKKPCRPFLYPAGRGICPNVDR